MGKAVPSPGNYQQAAQQQAQASQNNVNQQTWNNRPDIIGNTQSQQWTQGPDGRWTLRQGYGQSEGLANMLRGQAYDLMSGPMDDGTTARNQTIDSAYKAAEARLNPMWAQREQLRDSTLANQGIDPASAAAQQARREFSNSRNDAYNGALAAAIREGNASGSDVFRNNLAARNNPLQQLLALAGLQGPQFNTAGVGQTPDLLAALMGQDNANMKQWQLQQQQMTDAIGAGAQLLGAAGKLFAL